MRSFTQFKNRIILVSKSQLKLITSLQQKKYRDKYGLFVAEGPKVISELLKSGLIVHSLFSTSLTPSLHPEEIEVSELELKKISFLKTPNKALAVFQIPKQKEVAQKGLIVGLDAIRDPGNLGTIIRLCDWFGTDQLVCSTDTVDCYNPKVIQATMGSISRVHVIYTDLKNFLIESKLPIYGGCMDGTSVYDQDLSKDAILILGNEANGISSAILSEVNKKIAIPQFGKRRETESLNVATATAILLSEFKRATGK